MVDLGVNATFPNVLRNQAGGDRPLSPWQTAAWKPGLIRIRGRRGLRRSLCGGGVSLRKVYSDRVTNNFWGTLRASYCGIWPRFLRRECWLL